MIRIQTLLGPPKFYHRGEAVYEVVVGKTVTMDCDVEAEPKPEIHWFRGDSPLYLTENIHISPNGQVSLFYHININSIIIR